MEHAATEGEGDEPRPLTLPILVLGLGMPANVANGTNRIGVLVQSAVAALVFRRGRIGDGRVALRLLPIACAGALAGAWFASRISAAPMKRIMGIALLACLPIVLIPSSRWTKAIADADRRVQHPVVLGLVALGIGLYSGFLQAGIGIVILVVFRWALRIPLLEANHAKVILIGGAMIVALAMFAAAGQVDPLHGALLAVGQAAGAAVGARLVIRKGEALIRWVLAIAVLGSALQMIGLWR